MYSTQSQIHIEVKLYFPISYRTDLSLFTNTAIILPHYLITTLIFRTSYALMLHLHDSH
jgi:hypothetical protein